MGSLTFVNLVVLQCDVVLVDRVPLLYPDLLWSCACMHRRKREMDISSKRLQEVRAFKQVGEASPQQPRV